MFEKILTQKIGENLNDRILQCDILLNMDASNSALLGYTDYKFPNGNYLIHVAILNKNFSNLNVLLQCGANPNVRNDNGETPLCLAAYCGDEKMIKLLLKYGADKNGYDNTRKTPIFYSVKADNEKTLEELLKNGAAIRAMDFEGKTAKDYASKKNKKIIEIFERYK